METAIIRNDEDMSGEFYTIGKHSCFGCQKIIGDQFLSTVLDKVWHDDCIRCYTCQERLKDKCFSRDHKLYCRDDFYRTFGVKCSGCEDSIYPSDLVRRISQRIFHLSCLKCDQCKLEATTGDQIYLLDDGRFLCTKDYEIFAATVDEIKLNEERPSPLSLGQIHHDLQDKLLHTPTGNSSTTTKDHYHHQNLNNSKSNTDHHHQDGVSDDDDDANKRRGPRTTIKAKQLELLKAAFIATPKPSRHIREKLAADTGLTMRVIQVWFQNRRSKERRVKQLPVHDPARRNFRKGSIEKERTPVDLNYPFFQSPTSSVGMEDFQQQRTFNFDMYQQGQAQGESKNSELPNSSTGMPFPTIPGNENNATTTTSRQPEDRGSRENQQRQQFDGRDGSSNEFTMLDNPQRAPAQASVRATSNFNAFNNTLPNYTGQPVNF